MSAVPASQKKEWTEEELQALPDNGFNYEVVDGELVMGPKNNYQHGRICAKLLARLEIYAEGKQLGVACDSSTGFWMLNRNCRAPDVSFISQARLESVKQGPTDFFQGAPDLAVEVLSPNTTRREMNERLRDFFESGTQLVWIIDPETLAHRPPSPGSRWRTGRRIGCAKIPLPIEHAFRQIIIPPLP